MEPETGTAAVITITVLDGQQDEHGKVTAGGTITNWQVPDGQIGYLKDQLHRLCGEPVTEFLLPGIAQEVIEGIECQWPGAVKFTRDET
jgi:hypothetical protein